LAVAVSKGQIDKGDSTTVICFGTGDGAPCEDRNHASFLYRLGRTTILVDCGEAVDRSYKASGSSYDAIDAIFLSHLHSDHVGGFFMFMQGMWLESRRKPLKVYLPGKAIRPFREMLNTVFLFDEVLPFRLQLLALENEKTVKVRDVRVRPYYTTHLERTRAQFGKKYRADFSAYCFLIEHKGARIGHSADLGKPQDLEPLVTKPLDLLICELSHFTPEEVFSYLRNNSIKQIAFVHIGRAYRQDLPALRRLATKQIPNTRCRFPNDGDELSC
jgi:ribonuclease BN (tRNA processing enzyme)